MIKDLCKLYWQHEVAGSLCYKLCESQDFHFESCTGHRQGKTVVFMNCDSCGPGNSAVPVVLKMKTDLKNRDVMVMHSGPETITDIKMSHISELVRNSFRFLTNDTLPEEKDILSFAWGWDVQKYIDNNDNIPDVFSVAASSIWSLTEQPEYLLNKYLEKHSFIPKTYGTCGPAYLVEKTENLGKYEFEFLKGWSHSWTERATVAIKLIELMDKLEQLKPQLHLCDIKPDNFGIRGNGELTLIDIDCAMLDGNLIDQFRHSNCTTNDDCDFFDCRGMCDVERKWCLLKRTNNNMQSLCEDVFIGYFSKLPTGLLRDPPNSIKVQLFSLLQDCAYPESVTERHTARDSPRQETVQALQELLRKSIGEKL